MARRVFITVGEASGDRHAANFIRALRELDPTLEFEGLGGDAMREAGAIIHHETVRGARMGPDNALRALELLRWLAFTRKYFRSRPPDLQVCIDSWSINSHFIKIARAAGSTVLYYVAPQVWASRPGRCKTLARYVDHVACILPFEEKFLRDHGVTATFVGHPLFDAVSTPGISPRPTPDASSSLSLRAEGRRPVLGILPGSRKSVVHRNFPRMLQVADRILKDFPDTNFLIPIMPVTRPIVEQYLAAHPQRARFTLGDKFDELVPQCDLCLTVSGTATLHVAAHNVPMVIVYYIDPFFWFTIIRWFLRVRQFALVNLLGSGTIAPEFIPWYGPTAPAADAVLNLLHHPELMSEQRQRMSAMLRGIDRPGASRRAAELALDLMNGRARTSVPPTP